MTKNEKILKRALEMAVKSITSSCPFAGPMGVHCDECEGRKKTCQKVMPELFIRKAKEAICKGN